MSRSRKLYLMLPPTTSSGGRMAAAMVLMKVVLPLLDSRRARRSRFV